MQMKLFVLILLAVFLFGCEHQIACTAEAKICPDGSSVGRTGPNCEFAPCPETEIEEVGNFEECVEAGNPVMESYPRQCRHGDQTFTEEIDDPILCTADVYECPDGSYVARVPPTCEFAPCP